MMDNIDNDSPRFRPFSTSLINVKKAKYSTSLDPRGYIPVYEYLIHNQPIMWDRESGYVHFTGIWKSLGNSKADIVKMVDSNPELKVKKIRGGFLKIQGTWIPYDYAYTLCKRTAWIIRNELVPLFGPEFINDVIDPSHPEYGCLLLDPTCRRLSTVRQSHPYKRDFMRSTHRSTAKKSPTVASNMSLSRLLNLDSSPVMTLSSSSSSCSSEENGSPITTPSPTFRVVPSFSTDKTLLPPIASHFWSSPRTRLDQKDIIDTINATILLQRLSQDDGARPFKPVHPDNIPKKVLVNNQEFRICWD